VALGDSLTEGDGDDSGKGYSGRLIALIQKIRGGSQIANFGKSGWTSENLIKGHDGQPGQLKQALDAKPHLALVWIGSNDLWYLYEYGNPSGTTPKDEQEDLQNYRKNIETIVSELKKSGAMVFIALLDDQSKRPVALKGQAFTGITKGELDQMSKQVVAYNNAIKDVAAQQGALTVDFFNTKIFVDSATLYSDGNHPNEKGYDLIAGIWFKAMETVLK
jgi:lysophospholipase L1-like esterase